MPLPTNIAATNIAVTNIAAYKFAELHDLKPLRQRLLSQCKQWGLKGTILLSTEGINLFVAGGADEIELLLQELRAIPGLAALTPKYSQSEQQPFTRMLVRIKREIIAFGIESINPARYTSPRITAQELKQWLDEGRPVTLLDTRNDYEVKLGTFRQALAIGVDHFRDFPEAVVRLPADLRSQPIVTFCTGGIRCEKAAPYLEQAGFSQVYQLDGGILKYFEECGGAHYDGECFVFDQRVGVDPTLSETESTQCYACQSPLSDADQADARFMKGQSCPYCYETTDEQRARALAARHEHLRRVTSPLPGSVPYNNFRPLHISADYDGQTLQAFLHGVFPHVPVEQWEAAAREQRLQTSSGEPVALSQAVRGGERYLQLQPAITEPDVNAAIRILYEDEALVVVDKPAPLPMHPSGRFNRNTLQSILNLVYEPQNLRPAHRLDANTSGLVVLARSRHFAGLIQPQFARGEVEKEYLARVQGHPPEDAFACTLPISHEAGDLGSRTIDATAGLPARTEFRVVARYDDGTSLLVVRPLTGRTNQIRVHLWQLGWPICGEQSYLPDQLLGDTQTHDPAAPPLCLHARRLIFTHPLTRERVEFSTSAPAWATDAQAIVS